MPFVDSLFASPRKVFAHYFYTFPLSIDNQPSATDYYNLQFLTVNGENGKHAAYGGYLRARPLPVPVIPASSWNIGLNMQTEVRMAMARGITGFTFDILSLADALSTTGHLQSMLAAAQAVDPRFVIAPMLDMSSLGSITPAQAASIIQAIDKSLSVYRLGDGRIVMMAFNATLQPLSFWQSVISTLNAANVDVAFWPILLGGASDAGALDPVSLGVGAWGTAEPLPAAALQTGAGIARAAGLSFLLPILPQQFRPKDSQFWEAGNTLAFRNGWMSAINSLTDAVQIVTWSDFSESGQVQPYTDSTLSLNIGTGFYDLNAYYATWYLTKVQPAITRDVLYWCYRRETSTAAHPNQPDNFTVVGPAETSNIECLAFLTAPGRVVINGQGFQSTAGINSFVVPAAPGNPTMALQRNGSNVFAFTCPVTIVGPQGLPSGVTDLTYWSGSGSSAGLA